MKDRTQATITNDESNRQAEALTDLPVTEEQADRATGGVGATNNQGRYIVGVDDVQLR